MSQSLFVVKRGDTAPQFRAQCLDGTTPVDLTGTTARLLMKNAAGSLTVSAAMTVDDQSASPGWVFRPWGPSDLAVVGDYDAEVEVTWTTSGVVQTFPRSGYVTVSVKPDLG